MNTDALTLFRVYRCELIFLNMCDLHSDESKWVWQAAVQKPWPSSLRGNKGLALCTDRCLPVLLLSQMWRLVYLALVEALEILPWHVSTGCCPWPAHRRTAESSAQGTIHRQLHESAIHSSNLSVSQRWKEVVTAWSDLQVKGVLIALCQTSLLPCCPHHFSNVCSEKQRLLDDEVLYFLVEPLPLKLHTSSIKSPSHSSSANSMQAPGFKQVPNTLITLHQFVVLVSSFSEFSVWDFKSMFVCLRWCIFAKPQSRAHVAAREAPVS